MPVSRVIYNFFFLLSFPAGAFASCLPDAVSVKGDWGQVKFRVEIADDAEERARGLMHRENLPRLSGMLFVYPSPGHLAFWMRNTLIPLDMLFIDPTGQIRHIHSNAIPLDETSISGGEGNLAVLEINGGMAEQLGIATGSVIQHPAMPQDIAEWPCDDS